ncbi:MAG TPA: mechanosensitive ion channel family protein [Treponema sp.]|nr:mechanosensitive ion channel family protein [Treponema sp.]
MTNRRRSKLDETLNPAAQHTMTAAAQEATQAAQEHIAQQKETFMTWLGTFFTWGNLFKVIGAVVVVLIMWVIYKLVLSTIRKSPSVKNNVQRSAIATKTVKYIFYIVLVMYVLSCFGIKLTALLGAAGVAGLAVGFAAQTTVSNLISGLFVMGEGVMKIGDVINVGGITGIVDSVDLLSTKVHTFDNQMVRIPNSSIINTNFQNNSFFEKRRLTFAVNANYKTDIQKALDTFSKAPQLCPTVLQDPAPAVWVEKFGDSNVNMTVAVWYNAADYLKTRNDMFIALMKVMKDAGISMAYNCIEIAAHDDGKEKAEPQAKKRAARTTAQKKQ